MDKLDRRAFVQLAAGAAMALTAQAAGERKPLRLGVVTGGADSDAAAHRVRDLGFTNCQVYFGSPGADSAKRLRDALDKHDIEATSLIITGPGPEVYDFLQGPSTIGLVPAKYRDARIARMKQASDFAKMVGIPGIQGHCGFFPEWPADPLFGQTVEALRTVVSYCRANGQTFRCETGQ